MLFVYTVCTTPPVRTVDSSTWARHVKLVILMQRCADNKQEKEKKMLKKQNNLCKEWGL